MLGIKRWDAEENNMLMRKLTILGRFSCLSYSIEMLHKRWLWIHAFKAAAPSLQPWVSILSHTTLTTASVQYKKQSRQNGYQCKQPSQQYQVSFRYNQCAFVWRPAVAFSSVTLLLTVCGITRERACSGQTPLSTMTDLAGAHHVTVVTFLMACPGWTREYLTASVRAGLVTVAKEKVILSSGAFTGSLVALLKELEARLHWIDYLASFGHRFCN